MKTLFPILVFSLAVAFSHLGKAEVYRWTGPDGKTHFGDKPPAGTQGVETFKGGAGVSFMGGGGTAGAKKAAVRVKLFVTQTCTYCKKAKAYLRQRGTPFEELDIGTSRQAKVEYQQLGGNGVPVILVGQQRMDGFNQGRLEALLADAGL